MANKEDNEVQDVKYIREITEYFDTYMYALINEIYVGVGIALGLPEAEAYRLCKTDPRKLEKAGFFKSVFDRFKSIFSYRVPKFRLKKGTFGSGKPMDEKQWEIFNRSIDKFWKDHTAKIVEDVAVKSYMLGENTAEFQKKKKPYKNKSLYQVSFDQYDGDMPKTIETAYKKYDFSNSEKNIMNRSFSNVAMYVSSTNNDIKEAIRAQVTNGINDQKSPIEIASDLYWNVQKDETLMNKYTADSLRKNWHRIAQTEVQSVYEAGILAPYEAEAMESLKDPEKAKYFVRVGGSCDWCMGKRGVLVRLVPVSIVEDASNESLSAMGIQDPNTDIAIWPGKNNVGRKKQDWMICCPAHPYNVATFSPIDIKDEWYNPKTGDVEKRQVKQKFVPQEIDYTISREEKEYRKPTFVDSDIVRYNNNLYKRVPPGSYLSEKNKWDRNPSLPVPVSTDSTRYDKIFGEAERNKK
jgi:hypothetical protein